MYAAQRYFARSYFGGIWPSLVGELTVRPTGINEIVSFGTPSVQLQIQKILPTGIGQPVQFGTARLDLEALLSGIEQPSAFGTPRIDLELLPSGISQPSVFGTPVIHLELLPEGITQYIEFGTPGIQLEIMPAGIQQGIAVGTPEITLEITGIKVYPEGIAQPVEFGTPDVRLEINILPEGISQQVAFGEPYVWREAVALWPLEVNVRMIETPSLAQVRTRPSVAQAQFKELVANVNNILASSQTAVAPFQFESLVTNAESILTALKPTVSQAQFKALTANIDNIIAMTKGGNEVTKAIKVVVRQADTGQILSTYPVSIESILPSPADAQRLDRLRDVDATTEVEGGVPVYHEANDSYVVEKLDISDVDVGEIDGGTY